MFEELASKETNKLRRREKKLVQQSRLAVDDNARRDNFSLHLGSPIVFSLILFSANLSSDPGDLPRSSPTFIAPVKRKESDESVLSVLGGTCQRCRMAVASLAPAGAFIQITQIIPGERRSNGGIVN